MTLFQVDLSILFEVQLGPNSNSIVSELHWYKQNNNEPQNYRINILLDKSIKIIGSVSQSIKNLKKILKIYSVPQSIVPYDSKLVIITFLYKMHGHVVS